MGYKYFLNVIMNKEDNMIITHSTLISQYISILFHSETLKSIFYMILNL